MEVRFVNGFESGIGPTDTFTALQAANLTGAFGNAPNGVHSEMHLR